MVRILISYDGTASDRDALALGALLAGPQGPLELAYVRHGEGVDEDGRRLAAGAAQLGRPDVPQHVLVSASTPLGLRDLAVARDLGLIVFGSEYRTARGHVDPQRSAWRLLDGGPVAIAVAPAGYAQSGAPDVRTISALGEEGDPCTRETAERLALAFGAAVVPPSAGAADLVVLGSRAGTVTGRITISAAAEYAIGLSQCPVIVLPRGVALEFDRRAA